MRSRAVFVPPEASESSAEHRGRPSLEEYVKGVQNGDRVTLARAVTLVESERPADIELAARLLDAILPETGRSRRVAITGLPGAGKSTLIDALGMYLLRDRGQKVAVLSVDPASPRSGGSLLGDKTRMERLSVQENAFIRPSSSRGRLGGVAPRTREAILLCEAAGYANILIETVGIGQSETAVRSMSDFLLLVLIPGAGDELQGAKRGIIEMADAIAINKADGEYKAAAERAREAYASALHLFSAGASGWQPRVVTCSAITGEGIPEIWGTVLEHGRQLEISGQLAQLRTKQALEWMRELVLLGIEREIEKSASVARRLEELEADVRNGRATPFAASLEFLGVIRKLISPLITGENR